MPKKTLFRLFLQNAPIKHYREKNKKAHVQWVGGSHPTRSAGCEPEGADELEPEEEV